MSIEILKRDSLTEGGFAGLREHRLLMEPRVFGGSERGTWGHFGRLVYLADARFMPRGETMMHPHQEIDVISVVVKGRIAHQGSLGHGEDLTAFAVQVQRAGSEGFRHNEVNPDDDWNRMIQIWALPEEQGLAADYRVFRPDPGTLTRVYGGSPADGDPFPGNTVLDIALLNAGEELQREGQFLAYLTGGRGQVEGQEVADGDLLRGSNLKLRASDDCQIILVQTSDA